MTCQLFVDIVMTAAFSHKFFNTTIKFREFVRISFQGVSRTLEENCLIPQFSRNFRNSNSGHFFSLLDGMLLYHPFIHLAGEGESL